MCERDLRAMPARLKMSQSRRVIFDGSSNTGSVLDLWWLGQAGFALEAGGARILIDPYLSDSLAVKYAGKKFPHQRLMPIPIPPGEMKDIDAVLCTHRHSDHMDPGTLPAILEHNPKCVFVIPRAEIDQALSIGLPHYVLIPFDAGESLSLNKEIVLKSIPSAHETLKVNERGQYHYLGFILSSGPLTLYHSGDCIPYDGLDKTLSELAVNVALLPVNGRDEIRSANGVPGNFTITEAIDLCQSADIQTLIAQHFGMFDFNTVDPKMIEDTAAKAGKSPQLIIPEIGVRYTFESASPDQ